MRALIGYFKRNLPSVEAVRWPAPVFVLGPGVIGLGRHALEMIGGNLGTCRWSIASVLDTVLYAYVVAYVPLAMIVFMCRARPAQVRTGMALALIMTGIIHLIAPLGNILFHYHGPRWPEVHRLSWLPTHLYFTVGSAAGFLYALSEGTYWVRRVFGLSWRRAARLVMAAGGILFVYSYQLAVAFAFGPYLRLFYPAHTYPYLIRVERQTMFYNGWLALLLGWAFWFVLSRLPRAHRVALPLLPMIVIGIVAAWSFYAAYQ